MHKTFRDSLPLLVLSATGMVLFQILMVTALDSLAPQLMALWTSVGFLRNIFQVLFNIDLSQQVSMNTLMMVGYTHPVVFVIGWGFLITTCTRVTVGEIDRGTADLLLTLPISRLCVVGNTSLVWSLCAAVLAGSVWLGSWLGSLMITLPQPFNMAGFAIASVNLLLLLLAVGGLSVLISSLFNRRGIAIAVTASLLVASYVINFLEAFSDFFQRISFLGVLYYFRPVDVVRMTEVPWGHLLILAACFAICWTIGTIVFCRKDIPAP